VPGGPCPGAQIESELRDFVLGGVALEGEQKERFNEIQQELAQLSTKFSNNVGTGSLVLPVFFLQLAARTL